MLQQIVRVFGLHVAFGVALATHKIASVALGIGAALILHQLGWWVLDVNTLVVLPILSGLLFAGRAWLGTPYR